MPRDRGGIGKTGNKAKKAAERRAAAAKAEAVREASPPPAQAPAATNDEHVEEYTWARCRPA